MGTIDIIIIGVFVLGAVLGLMKGFIKQLASLLGLIVGLLAAKMLYVPLAEKLSGSLTDSMSVAQIIAFIAIWVIVPLAFALAASLLTKAMEMISLGWLNRWLGAGLGALKFILAASVLICIIEFIDGDNKLINKESKEQSVLYYPVGQLAGIFMPAAKAITQEVINADI